MRYIANPVVVEAKVITKVEDGGPQSSGVFHLTLEDGSKFSPDGGMTSRMSPKVGDYVVTQSDGYVYLNPKNVFERKYRPDELNALELGAEVRRLGLAGK